MAWDFTTEPEFEEKLDWMLRFVGEEIYPLETLNLNHKILLKAIAPLQAQVKAQGLWAAYLPPELGGAGFGQVKLALMHEILGRSVYAPLVFGNNAPDSGNVELLANGVATTKDENMKKRWLLPLLEGQLRSGFSMTEPETAGSDPMLIATTARRDGDEWVINGHKWFTTNGSIADFLIVMALSSPEAEPRRRFSMFIVPVDTQGVNIVRDVPTLENPTSNSSKEHFGYFGAHSEIRYDNVRIPSENLIGREGDGFLLAQQRLGPGRIHHCMRWLGQARRAFDMLCERAVSRFVHGSVLSEKQGIQNWIADSLAEMTSARLLTLYAAWKIDREGPAGARVEIAMIKYHGAGVLYNVIDRAIQVHGALGFSSDLPLEAMYRAARAARIYDGPDEVHKITVAKRVLRQYTPSEIPTEHIPTRQASAKIKFAKLLEETSADS
ncbi:MAG: acyl-CoA dehydrogenase family protein [Actinobacteria bacterium]|nr:acyl-CoA dehydrogenase family protein [Actinomycetota bacterium]MCL6104350.1 acyl-CoA dehydrogenase family protein [Actinomycetota bacterium]